MNEPFRPCRCQASRSAQARISDALVTIGSLLAAILFSGIISIAAEAKPHGETGAPRLVVYVGNDPADLTCFERWVDRSVDGVQIHTGAADWNDWASSIGWLIDRWQSVGRTIYWSIPLIPKGATLAEAAQGAYDGRYREAAEKLAKAPGEGPIQVRTGWEFNGSWMIWAAAGKEDDFIGAFRHFVAAFRGVSARFVFEWSPNIGDHGMDPSRAYPGDDVVDIVGIDFYYKGNDYGPDPEVAWRKMLEQRYGLMWLRDFAKSRGKPMAASEWGVDLDVAGPYVAQAGAWFRENKFVYQSYWNSDADFTGKFSGNRIPAPAAIYRRSFVGEVQRREPPAC